MAKIGVALSGGGHRAALFGLGVLLYLADAEKNAEVTSIASVSGGSLTNGYVAQSVDYPTATPQGFREAVSPMAQRIAQKGTVWPPSLFTTAYLLLLVVVAALGLVGVWFLPWPVGIRVLAFVVGLIVVGFIAGLRGAVASRAFSKTLYSANRTPTPLSGIATSLDHVFCAADLHAGENVYFSGAFVCSYRFGWGRPADLPLHVAVQCSAALPGAFPPRWLKVTPHGFEQGQPEAAGVTRMALVDGGVYDNMADQWGLGIYDRKQRWPTLAQGLHEPEELIIVNASAGLEWTPVWKVRLPVLGEILALLKDKTVLYDNGNAVRRELAVDRFRQGPLKGALVHIPQSPLHTPERYAGGDDAAAARAQTVLALLEPHRDEWERTARESAKASTSLSPLRTATAARLLHHGYVLAMANLHVILDYPLLDVPDRQAFEAIVE